MSMPKDAKAKEELERIEEALIDSLLNSSGDDLRAEIEAAGGDANVLIAEVEATIAKARAECANRRLQEARAEFLAWQNRSGQSDKSKLEAARARLERIRTGDRKLDSRMMLAARKGEGLSEQDLNGLAEDIADLDELECRESDE